MGGTGLSPSNQPITKGDPLARLETRYQQTLDGLDAVRLVGEILGETFDEAQICRKAVQIFVDHLPFENCSIMLLDPDGRALSLVAAAGKGDEDRDENQRETLNRNLKIQVGEGVAGEVVATGNPAILADAGRSPQFKQIPSAIPIRSLLCLPLHAKNEVIGVINLSHPEIEEISVDQEKTLEVLSRMVGQVITITRLSSALITGQLRRTERLAGLGQLAASIAHEVNNPLTNILLRAQKLQGAKGLDDRERKHAADIQDESERIARILSSVLDYARDRRTEMQPTDLNRSVGRALELTLPLQGKKSKVRVERELQEDLPLALADPYQIEQVFTNLVMNAFQAMDNGGVLRISTRLTPEEQVEVCFQDSGHGLHAEQLDEIFEPFFTTRGDNGGTGLGLAIPRQIVRDYQGDLRVDSRPNEGATFTVVLPPSPPASA